MFAETTGTAAGDTLFWFQLLADVSIKGLLIMAVAAGAAAMMRRSSGAARHLVWTVAVAGLLVLPVLSLALPAWRVPILPKIPVGAPPGAQPMVTSLPDSMVPELPPLRPGLREGPRPFMSEAGEQAVPARMKGPSAVAATTDLSTETEITSTMRPPIHWSTWITWGWLIGSVVVFAPLLIGLVSVRRLARRARCVNCEPWAETGVDLIGSFCGSRPVRLLQSDAATVPMTWGILRPAILLPAEAVGWAAERLRLVVLHEMAHVRRRDCLTQLLGHCAAALYWFNPLVWLALRRMRIERERACDDFVLSAGLKASDYADHLLDIARSYHASGCAPVAAVAMARRSQIEGRLLAILDATRSRRGVSALAAIAALALGTLLVAPLAMMQASERADRSDQSGQLDKSDRADASKSVEYSAPVSSVPGLTHEIAWGKAVDGLQIGLGWDGYGKPVMSKGGWVSYELYARNVGRETITIPYSEPALQGWRPTILDATGKEVDASRSNQSEAGSGPTRRTLEPGEVVSLARSQFTVWAADGSNHIEGALAVLAPGTYRFSQSYRFWDTEPGDWFGKLSTGWMEMNVVDEKQTIDGAFTTGLPGAARRRSVSAVSKVQLLRLKDESTTFPPDLTLRLVEVKENDPANEMDDSCVLVFNSGSVASAELIIPEKHYHIFEEYQIIVEDVEPSGPDSDGWVRLSVEHNPDLPNTNGPEPFDSQTPTEIVGVEHTFRLPYRFPVDLAVGRTDAGTAVKAHAVEFVTMRGEVWAIVSRSISRALTAKWRVSLVLLAADGRLITRYERYFETSPEIPGGIRGKYADLYFPLGHPDGLRDAARFQIMLARAPDDTPVTAQLTPNAPVFVGWRAGIATGSNVRLLRLMDDFTTFPPDLALRLIDVKKNDPANEKDDSCVLIFSSRSVAQAKLVIPEKHSMVFGGYRIVIEDVDPPRPGGRGWARLSVEYSPDLPNTDGSVPFDARTPTERVRMEGELQFDRDIPIVLQVGKADVGTAVEGLSVRFVKIDDGVWASLHYSETSVLTAKWRAGVHLLSRGGDEISHCEYVLDTSRIIAGVPVKSIGYLHFPMGRADELAQAFRFRVTLARARDDAEVTARRSRKPLDSSSAAGFLRELGARAKGAVGPLFPRAADEGDGKRIVYRGFDLTTAPVTTKYEELPALFEDRPPGSKSYHLRDEVVSVRDPKFLLSAVIHYVPSKNVYFIQYDPAGASTLHYYGPFTDRQLQGIDLPKPGAQCRVVTPDGKPAIGATVVLAAPNYETRFVDGRFRIQWNNRNEKPIQGMTARTGDDGMYAIKPERAYVAVVVRHETGYAEVTPFEAGATAEIQLEPWSRIEGVLLHDGKPVPETTVTLRAVRAFVASGRAREVWLMEGANIRHETTTVTNAQGRFGFENVPGGTAWVERGDLDYGIMGGGTEVDVKPGKTAEATLGLRRKVIGRFVVPEGATQAIDPLQSEFRVALDAPPFSGTREMIDQIWGAYAEFLKSEEGKPYVNEHVQVAVDGSFQFELLPGRYMIQTKIVFAPQEAPAGERSLSGWLVTKFAVPGTAGEEEMRRPVDLGVLQVQWKTPPAESNEGGDFPEALTAPRTLEEIRTPTKPFRLSDNTIALAKAAAQKERVTDLRRRRPEGLQNVETDEGIRQAIEQSMKELGDAETKVQYRGLANLQYLGDLAFPDLVRGLESENAIVRKWSVVALEDRGSGAVEPLSRIVREDPEASVRAAAASALGQTFDPRCVSALIEAINDTDLHVSHMAINALVYLRDPRALDPLRTVLFDAAIDFQLRRLAADALVQIDPVFADRAIDEAVAAETEDGKRDQLRRMSREPSGYAYWPPELLPVHQLVKDAGTIRGEKYGPVEIDALLEHAGSSQPSVAAECLRALGELHADSAVDRIIEIGTKNTGAISALVQIASPKALDYVLNVVQTGGKEERVRAIGALGGGGRWAVPVLIELLDDPTLLVKHEGEVFPVEGFDGIWPDEHVAHRALFNCLSRAGLQGTWVNLATGKKSDVNEEIRRLKKWWADYGRAFLDGKPVPNPNISTTMVAT